MVQDAITIQPEDAAELRVVSQLLRRGSPTLANSAGEHATLPAPIYDLLKDIVQNLEKGRSLVLLPEEKQLTTQRAAELLGMSRPYLIQLLEAGEMPFHLVGNIAVSRCAMSSPMLNAARKRAEPHSTRCPAMPSTLDCTTMRRFPKPAPTNNEGGERL